MFVGIEALLVSTNYQLDFNQIFINIFNWPQCYVLCTSLQLSWQYFTIAIILNLYFIFLPEGNGNLQYNCSVLILNNLISVNNIILYNLLIIISHHPASWTTRWPLYHPTSAYSPLYQLSLYSRPVNSILYNTGPTSIRIFSSIYEESAWK